MRILILTQWFAPEPSLKGLPLAKALKDRGYEVEVLTGFPNYPGGKLYPGYRVRLWQRETIDGVSVIRVALYPSHDRSSLRRMANYLSFGLSSAALGTFLTKKPDIIYVYNLVTLGLTAIMLKLLKGCPFVYDIQDLWPDSISASGMLQNRHILSVVDRWCKVVYRYASRIVTLSPGFAKTLCARGVPISKLQVIYNWCEESQAHLGERDAKAAMEQYGLSGRFNVVYAGNIGIAQALDAVLDAAEIVERRHPKVQFVLVGDGVELAKLKEKASNMRLHNVLFLARRPASEIGRILEMADVLLVHLRNDPLYHVTIPSKTQAYMLSGKPILMGVRGDAADLVQRAKAGIACAPENPESIARAVEEFISRPRSELLRMGRNGLDFYKEELSVEVGVRRFIQLFEAVAGEHRER